MLVRPSRLHACAGVLAACALSLSGSAAAAANTPVATGTGGAVVSDSAPATAAGLAVLRHGGTAADAAVAVASTLGVTDPFVAGIGGGGYFVYYDAKTHRVYTLDGRETAPAADTSKLFLDPQSGKPLDFPVAVTSGLSVGVPGNLMTWAQAQRRWGRFSLATDLEPAQAAARRGFTVTPTLREEIRENAFRFADFRSTRALFLPGGKLPRAGSRLRNPDLAATYALIGRRGVGALYGGAIGADVINTVHHLPLARGAKLTPRPGKMTLADLRRYRAILRAPTHVSYDGYDVYSMAPSSSGGTTVGETLNILSRFDIGAEDRTQALYDEIEASRQAYADRNRYIGDPRFVSVPLIQLLSPTFALQRACRIAAGQAATSPVAPGDPFTGASDCPTATSGAALSHDDNDTNHFVVADRFGDVVSYTNTIEELGGSAVVVPGRGFLLNNELTDFDFTPLQTGVPDPNLPQGGKRPRSSMSPTIVLNHGRPFLAAGAAGGATIITTVLGILVNRLDFHMPLAGAIAAPRFSQENKPATVAEPAFIHASTTAGLQALGEKFDISDTSPLKPSIKISPEIGMADGLEFLGGGRVEVAGEPAFRRGGSAAGVVKPSG